MLWLLNMFHLVCCWVLGLFGEWRSIHGDTYWCQWIPPFLPFHAMKPKLASLLLLKEKRKEKELELRTTLLPCSN